MVFFHQEAETGEVCLGESYEEGAEHGGERQVLQRVIQDLEEGDECLDFQVLHIVIVSGGNGGDVMVFQDLEQGGAFRGDGAEKDHDVPILDGTEGAVFIHHLSSLLDEAFDMAGDEAAFGVDFGDFLELGLVRLGQFAAIDEFDRDAAADVVFRARFFVASRIEGFGIAVGELQIFLCHELPEKVVDGGKDGGIASKVAVQVDALVALAFLMEAVVLGEENRGVCLAEAVDALLDVADKEAVMPVREEGGDELLNAIRILILVDHDFFVVSSDGECSFGGEVFGVLGGEGWIFRIEQKGERVVLEVIEFHHAFLLFPCQVAASEVERKRGEDFDFRGHGARLFSPLRGRNGEKGDELFLIGVFGHVAKSFDRFRVRGFVKIRGLDAVGFGFGGGEARHLLRDKGGHGIECLPCGDLGEGGKEGVLLAERLAIDIACDGIRIQKGEGLPVKVADFSGGVDELG